MQLRLIYIFFLCALAAVAGGCADEFEIGGSRVQPGLPAEITVDLSLSDAESVSRGDMADGLDKKVGSLWIAVYNADSGERTGLYKALDISQTPSHSAPKSITINTISADRNYIVAVANFDYRFAAVDDSGDLVPLGSALDAADTWERFRNISVAFDENGMCNVSAPLNALVMSGWYVGATHSDGKRPPLEPVAIQSGSTTLPGMIHLRRMISQVKFNVEFNKDNISDFDVKSWRVVNLPAASWLHERDDSENTLNSTDMRTAAGQRFHSSAKLTETTLSGNKVSFDFWQLENRHTGLPVPAEFSANPYAYRDKEFKLPDGTNSGKFISLVADAGSDDLNNMATYVEFDVDMNLKVDENGTPVNGTRHVESTYRVHLGYCEGSGEAKARDFNCRRNTLYTYNVKINNVNDIIVEAAGSERNPAVEGIVSDITADFRRVDAHYNQFNIYLSAADLRTFKFYITAFDENGAQINISSEDPATVPTPAARNFKYLDWIEFRYSGSETKMATYSPRSKNASNTVKTLLLTDIDESLQPGWYTMFINEYVYETGSHANGYEVGSSAWHGYVNRPDRRVWLNVSGNVSADGNSIYQHSKYAVSQSSIQTYYTSSSATALGVERVNESYGLNLRNSFNPGWGKANPTNKGVNDRAARFNLAQYFTGDGGISTLNWKDDTYKWADHLDLERMQDVHAVNTQGVKREAHTEALPFIKTRDGTESYPTLSAYDSKSLHSYDPDQTASPYYIEAIKACLNRNRDLDGDGMIDADELRWVVPTSRHALRMIIGRNSLDVPLFDVTTIDRLPNNRIDRNGENASMLVYTSDGKIIWTMEGASESGWRQWPTSVAAAWNVRCVRNLGGDFTVISSESSVERAFVKREGENIIDLTHFDSKSIRSEAMREPMPPHNIRDTRYNRTYKAFEYAEDVIAFKSGDYTDWAAYLRTHNPCASLNSGSETGWRVPNQTEMAILGILGLQASGKTNGVSYQLTSSFSYFDLDGYGAGKNPDDPDATISASTRYTMSIVTNGGHCTQTAQATAGNSGVRCVRDCE